MGIKFQLYNSLFGSLPFHRIEKTGVYVSLLLVECEEGFQKGLSPREIVDKFFASQTNLERDEEKADLLFRFVQFIERQVVLFDALEDAGFTKFQDVYGKGSIKHINILTAQQQKREAMIEALKTFNVQLVLTAHPTQFYRQAVLGIINDLSDAVAENDESVVYTYLQQLGRTPFFQKEKPTPFDEAMSLIWHMENVFYHATGRIVGTLKENYPEIDCSLNPIIKMGFWPGGDRDGNPFVTSDTTLRVAGQLRGSVVRCYYRDVKKLRRRLTFRNVEPLLIKLETVLYDHLNDKCVTTELSKEIILDLLNEAKHHIKHSHNNLFLGLLETFISKVEVFGLHFASIDVRQESTQHTKTLATLAASGGVLPEQYLELDDRYKLDLLANLTALKDDTLLTDGVQLDCIRSVKAIKEIQRLNGEPGCNRYIISQCTSALNVMEVFGLFLLGGWTRESLTVDIVPLFETVDDLHKAAQVMRELYENSAYALHLKHRGKKQTIMVGFSDGTKDGGYLMANWGIYKAKEELSIISKEYGIDVVFFDGRGGPPARGGGKTHQFYASMGKHIASKEIQLTIQGQTVSSNFGTIDTAQYNMEQLVHAGLSNRLFATEENSLSPKQEDLISELAEISFRAYSNLKEHPSFSDYLSHASPLRFYAETNIGSRPAKRGSSSKLSLKELRAIPFVGAWSQLKQNVTGYYGVGTAFQTLEAEGRWSEAVTLYQHSMFFKTLMDNCEMAMSKCFFPLTAHLKSHPIYGGIWEMVHTEFEQTRKYVLKLSGHATLMQDYPIDQLSIQMRERIVMPLVTLQQYAITKVREMEEQKIENPGLKATYEKLAMRCSFGIINAGRNSA